MKRKGDISPRIETEDNFVKAFDGFSENKHYRPSVQEFEADIVNRISFLLEKYRSETWKSSTYKEVEISERGKKRKIGKYPINDHIIQWAALVQIEKLICDTFIRRSCSCVKYRGQHDFVNIIRKTLYKNVEGTWYFVQLDAHHFFENIPLHRLLDKIRRKIKDDKLIRFIEEVIYSFGWGLVLGTKLSQILANYYLSDFDHLVGKVFNLLDDKDTMAYWRARYVTDSFVTCRTVAEAKELAKGVEYMNSKFDKYVQEGLIEKYERFADNIVIHHGDKTFLHLITELCIMHLARDEYLQVNKDWNVRPVYNGGIDVCGYVSYHTHRRLRKRNKTTLCRQVAKWKKKGMSPEEIRLKESSRIGYAIHGNCNNLLRNLDINMEKRLGALAKSRHRKIPFDGMSFEQKKSIEDIICKEDEDESNKLILITDYKIDDSVFEKDDEGNPKKRLVIRYKMIENIEDTGEKEPKYHWSEEEYFSYSGSRIMIEQLEEDIQKEDLPLMSAIKEYHNKFKKTFYKLT